MNVHMRLPSRLVLQRALLALACVLLSLALFAPPLKVNRETFDLLAVVDITQSMNVLDYPVDGAPMSRLAFTKRALQRTLLDLPCGSKLGLGIFTEYRTFVLFTPVEVCRNRTDLAAALEGISGQMAWANASEIAKGLYSGLHLAAALPDKPALVFITDGHEAPPLNPRYRLRLEGRLADMHGVIVGAGGLKPQPIPKIDPDGNRVGFWQPDEVLQTDLYARGRGGSVANEQMTESGTAAAPLPQDQPSGHEQLSALHENYLKLLASETGLAYHRLVNPADLTEALRTASLARHEAMQADIRWLPGGLALLTLVAGAFHEKYSRARKVEARR